MGNKRETGVITELEPPQVAELNIQQGGWWLGHREDFPTVRGVDTGETLTGLEKRDGDILGEGSSMGTPSTRVLHTLRGLGKELA